MKTSLLAVCLLVLLVSAAGAVDVGLPSAIGDGRHRCLATTRILRIVNSTWSRRPASSFSEPILPGRM